MTRMTGPDCAVMCNFIHTHIHLHFSVKAMWISVSAELIHSSSLCGVFLLTVTVTTFLRTHNLTHGSRGFFYCGCALRVLCLFLEDSADCSVNTGFVPPPSFMQYCLL